MSLTGRIKKDKRTKNLIPRLLPGDIALIDHEDLDRVSAESLAATGVAAVINVRKSVSGLYPNQGPLILLHEGVVVLDDVGEELFNLLEEEDQLCIKGDCLYKDDQFLARGVELTEPLIHLQVQRAEAYLANKLDDFTRNTLSYLEDDRTILLSDMWTPPTELSLHSRHVLVVIRGHDYKEDLRALHGYIREMRPVFIGVDGGADALLEEGYKPDIIIGDMDSVSNEALISGAQLIAHAYADGSCPAAKRLESLHLSFDTWELAATSEDLALLLAYHAQASLIVAVGSHANLIEYLDKKRSGMSSTFLVRLKVGDKLVDAKGVSKLYRSAPSPKHLISLLAAAFLSVAVIIGISPQLQASLSLLWLSLKNWMGLNG